MSRWGSAHCVLRERSQGEVGFSKFAMDPYPLHFRGGLEKYVQGQNCIRARTEFPLDGAFTLPVQWQQYVDRRLKTTLTTTV